MDLLALLNGLVAQLADAQKAADDLAKLKYDEGFAAGVASVPPPVSDKIFSQGELDAAVLAAVEPLQARVLELESLVEEVRASVQPKIDEAVAALKADLLAKYEAQQLGESESESAIRELLK